MTFASTDICSELLVKSRSYINAAVQETFEELGFNHVLSKQPQSSDQIANALKLNSDATARFLNAAATLGLAYKQIDGTFVKAENPPIYSGVGSISLFWLVRNRVPDRLKEKPRTIEALKREFGEDAALYLDMAVKTGFLELSDGQYRNVSSLERFLITSSPETLAPTFSHFDQLMAPMFSKNGLIGALRTGRSQWHEVFGEGVTNPFDLYRDRPEMLDVFMNGMHQLNAGDNTTLVRALDLSTVRTVLDVGGGSGPFAIELLKTSKTIEKVDIFELPEAIPLLQRIFNRYAPKSETRAKFVAGSFLDKPTEPRLEGLDLSRKYDVITMGWILHDWNDTTSLVILKKVAAHLGKGGRLVIVESVLPENRTGTATLLDLAMLLQTQGRERTFSEYKTLLTNAGFGDIRLIETPTRRQMIEARL